MNNNSNSETSPSESSPVGFPILIGILVTVIWLAVVLVFTKNTPGGIRSVFCLSPNEFGDFMAGTFAPLAFVWLVVAVLIQKEELHAQLVEFRRSVDQAEAQTRHLSTQVEIQARAFSRDAIKGKFALIAATIENVSTSMSLVSDVLQRSVRSNDFEESIKEFNRLLWNLIEEQGGLGHEWDAVPERISPSIESVMQYLPALIVEVDSILEWQDANDDSEIQGMIVASELQRFKQNVTIVVENLRPLLN